MSKNNHEQIRLDSNKSWADSDCDWDGASDSFIAMKKCLELISEIQLTQ